MTFNPEKNAPIKINLERIKLGLSQEQLQKIKYECDLLRKDIQELLYIAPHLFTEGVTAANTVVIKEKKKPEVVEETLEGFKPSEESQNPYGGYYPDYNSYDDMG